MQEEWSLFQGKDDAMEELAQEHQSPLLQKIVIDSVSETYGYLDALCMCFCYGIARI